MEYKKIKRKVLELPFPTSFDFVETHPCHELSYHTSLPNPPGGTTRSILTSCHIILPSHKATQRQLVSPALRPKIIGNSKTIVINVLNGEK
tara:strand:+ start:2243 stop:2515 length:273 start_codon:yes stop_codon:yes gene_type:complete